MRQESANSQDRIANVNEPKHTHISQKWGKRTTITYLRRNTTNLRTDGKFAQPEITVIRPSGVEL